MRARLRQRRTLCVGINCRVGVAVIEPKIGIPDRGNDTATRATATEGAMVRDVSIPATDSKVSESSCGADMATNMPTDAAVPAKAAACSTNAGTGSSATMGQCGGAAASKRQ